MTHRAGRGHPPMTALSRTHAAVRHVAQNAPAALTRNRALLLDQLLTACDSVAPPPGVLRQVVIAIRNLAGTGWLTVHAGDPSIQAFIRLDDTPVPPPLPVLDRILADCLWARFGPGIVIPPVLAGTGRTAPAGR